MISFWSIYNLCEFHPTIRHEMIAMFFRLGVTASALLERYKLEGFKSRKRSSSVTESACKKKKMNYRKWSIKAGFH